MFADSSAKCGVRRAALDSRDHDPSTVVSQRRVMLLSDTRSPETPHATRRTPHVAEGHFSA